MVFKSFWFVEEHPLISYVVLQKYYQHYVDNDNIEYYNTLRAAHTMPTDERVNSNACTTSATPYIR